MATCMTDPCEKVSLNDRTLTVTTRTQSGHHDTTVHERIAPGITHENVQRTQHENVTTAVDKEIHQHHYHTSVQPVTDKNVLPEKHSHNMVPVEHRGFEHGDPNDVKARLAAEEAKFKDERIVGDTHHTHSVAPVVSGEHIHHHVHETIQPVVQRRTSIMFIILLDRFTDIVQKPFSPPLFIPPCLFMRLTIMPPR